ncbi:MAG TPA: ion transporter [Rhizomicrobium sp.]|nr:ion transporter [Rhizomicrobium sp.]
MSTSHDPGTEYSGHSLRLGSPQDHGSGWGFALFDGQDRLLSALTFGREDQARHAHEAMQSAWNVTVAPEAPKRDAVPEAAASDLVEQSEARRPSLRQWMHALLEEGQMESLSGRIIEVFLIILIVANVAAVALETIPLIYAPHAGFFKLFEEFSLAIYTIEYMARIWSSVEDPRVAARGAWRGRLTFALRPLMVVDFLAVVPSLIGQFFGLDLRVLRIFRLFRLLKLARYSQALQALLGVLLAERSSLFASTLLLFATVCFFGELMHLAEGSLQPHVLGTMPGGMYWAITTLATVGYGDIVPATPLGKFIAGCTMAIGVALFALPVGIIANGFVTGLSRRRFAITWSMLRRQPLFRGFDIDALNTILEVPTAHIARQHAQVTVAGKEASALYLVVSGRACAETGDHSEELGPGAIFGEEALHHAANYTQTVTAEADMRIIAFSGDELRRLCRKYPLLQQRIEQSLARAARNYGGATHARRLDELEVENGRLRRILSDRIIERLVPGVTAQTPPAI